jgi:pilus assembly protein CpaE
MSLRILAVDDNLVNLKVVSVTLQSAGYQVITATSGREALTLAEKDLPDLIILDITMPEMDGYEVAQRLRSNPLTGKIPIMMLTAHDTLEEKIKGFESGADEYLTKPFQPAELQARVKVLLRRTPVEPQPAQKTNGKVIGVFSLRGGVGVSTMATNLAAGLTEIWKRPAVLVDMAVTMGQSALMVNLPLRNTWADLARMKVEDIEWELVKNVLLNHTSGLAVLAGPRSPIDGELMTAALVTQVFEMLRAHYPYLVVDLPHDFHEITLTALDNTDDLLLLLSPELASIRAASGALEVFDSIEYPREKIHLVLNWTFERRGLARKDIENVLRKPIELIIPYAAEAFVSAINTGVPPVIGAPDSPLCALFEDIAFQFSREDDKKVIPSTPSASYLRLQERQASRQSNRPPLRHP